MDISSLYIFAKNTDAHASIKGYNFQTLKTVETWVANYIGKVDGKIYCEFEEDIFEYSQEVLKFRQLKLYSSNFSFSTEEVQKAIFHFFMLHVKMDYKDNEKEFIFEANSSIAQTYKDNNAELLSDWNDSQGKLEGELLKKCINKAIEIIGKNITPLLSPPKGAEVKPEILIGKKTFDSLTEEDWKSFIQCIRWKFADNDPETEFTTTIQRINNLIDTLPYPDIDESALLGILYKHVSLKASEKIPEDRALSRAEFDQLLLSTGSDNDRWYIEVFEKWKNAEEIAEFHIGDFYEILNAAKYCRTSPYLIEHTPVWLSVLATYIFKLEIRRSFKLEAIYEYIWLNIRPTEIHKLPVGTLEGVEDVIRGYFADFRDFYSTNDLENAQSILSITTTAVLMRKANFPIVEIVAWYKGLYRTIKNRLRVSTNPNEICHLLEELGSLKMFLIDYRIREIPPESYVGDFEEILKHVDHAPLYHLTTLGKRINEYINIYIKAGSERRKHHIEAIEVFSEKLDSYIRRRNGDIDLANVQVQRGVAYLRSDDRQFFLKSLTCFHTAKDLYFTNETIEGFVLALLNITQVYSAIGMHFAAKYYALAAAWVCLNSGDKKLLHRIEAAYRLMFYSDFKSGSWFSAMMDIEQSFNAAEEFNPTESLLYMDEAVLKSLSDLIVIFYAGLKLSPQFLHLIEYQIKRFGEDVIKDSMGILEELDTEKKLVESLEQRVDDIPFNDCSKRRHINFYALGTLWQIEFDNSYRFTPLGEEFCSALQIVLTEISLSNIDFHFIKGTVKINLTVGEYLEPSQVANDLQFEWNVTLAYFESTDVNDTPRHFARISTRIASILNKLSLLPTNEFIDRLTAFLSGQKLAAKASVINAYQKMYRLLFHQNSFENIQRGTFHPIEQYFKLPLENQFMQWRSDLSSKYNSEEAVEIIENRFKGTYKRIHKTLESLKHNEDFKAIIMAKRQLGYLDWEIALAIMNFIVQYKAERTLSNINFNSQDSYIVALREELTKIHRLDEEECYVKFPAEAFKEPGFDLQLKQIPHMVLKAYGLENKSTFLNFKTIREFLSIRFKLYEKQEWKGNFLKDIV